MVEVPQPKQEESWLKGIDPAVLQEYKKGQMTHSLKKFLSQGLMKQKKLLADKHKTDVLGIMKSGIESKRRKGDRQGELRKGRRTTLNGLAHNGLAGSR